MKRFDNWQLYMLFPGKSDDTVVTAMGQSVTRELKFHNSN